MLAIIPDQFQQQILQNITMVVDPRRLDPQSLHIQRDYLLLIILPPKMGQTVVLLFHEDLVRYRPILRPAP
jgi:hypothetical protein